MERLLLKMMTALGIICILIGLILSMGESTVMKDRPIKNTEQNQNFNYDEYAELSFEQLKTMNTAFVGKLNVGEIIKECVVKSSDNEDYLSMNLEGNPYGEGTVFLDFRNQQDDQNLILYGTTVFSNMSLRFGPLSSLVNQSEYEKQMNVVFEFENESKTYEICAVMHFDINETEVDYAKPNYSEDEMSAYMNYIASHNLISPIHALNQYDCFLTLQSDVKDHPEVKLVVIAKEVNR